MDKRYQLKWSARAIADLRAIGAYIAADNQKAAARWVTKLLKRSAEAAMLPYAGRIVPEFKIAVLREVFVRTYRIVDRICGDEVQVITVFEGHGQFPSDIEIEGEP